MKLAVGETVQLNSTHYRVEKMLGSGAVADAYQAAFVAEPGSQVVIKLVRDDQVRRLEAHEAGQAPLTSREREELLRMVDGLRQEKQVLETLNQAEQSDWPETDDPILRWRWAEKTCLNRRIVAVLDSGELGPFQPFVVQEKAPTEFKRFDVTGWQGERRLVAVAVAIAEAISLAHRCNVALLDFDPHTKGDRIRLQGLDADGKQPFDLKIIDWNVTGGPKDVAQDLFFFGCHLYYLFLGRHLPLDQRKQPPPDLDIGLPAWEDLCDGSRQILQRLLHRDPRQRYQQADRMVSDLAWWLEALREADAPDPLGRLQDRLLQARRGNRHDLVLSVADLAQRLDLPLAARQSFEQQAHEARKKLEDEIWRPISLTMAKLRTGQAYARAAEEFQEQIRALPPEGEQARRARIYYHLARAGDLFKQARPGQDIRREPAWLALERACDALVKRQWLPALGAIQEAKSQVHEVTSWQPVDELQKLSQAGQLLQEANDLGRKAEPRRADSGRADWAQIEVEQIAELEAALAKLQEARNLAALEPIFGQQWQAVRERLDLRRDLMARYRDVEALMRQGEEALQNGQQAEANRDYEAAERAYWRAVEPFQTAADELRAILEADAAQYRAAEWLKSLNPSLHESQEHQQSMAQQVEIQRRFEQAWSQVQPLLASGSYGDAVSLLQEAADLLPGRADVRDRLALALVGARVERLAQGYLETAHQHFRLRNLEEAKRAVDLPLPFHGQALSRLPGGQNLPKTVALSPFVLRNELDSSLKNLLDWIPHVAREREKADEARESGDHERLEGILGELQGYLEEKGETLTDEELGWRRHAQQWGDIQETADTDLERLERRLPGLTALTAGETLADLFDLLCQTLDSLAQARGASALRDRAWQIWLHLVEKLPDLRHKEERLQEGRRHPLLQEPSTVQRFEIWLGRVQTGLEIERDLDLAGGECWPSWLDGVGAGEKLRRLAVDLPSPGAADTQPISQEQIRAWRERLADYLEAFLAQRLVAVRKLSRESQFQEAVDGVQRLWAFVPDSLRPPLWKQAIDEFGQALRSRLQAEASMGEVVGRLVGRDDSFPTAHDKARQVPLPQHDDVPVDDLRAFVKALHQAREMEKVLHDPPQANYPAGQIAQYHSLAGEPLTALRGLDLEKRIQEELDYQVEELRNKLRYGAERTAVDMGQELEKRVLFLWNNPTADPGAVLHLYWQVRWWRAKSSVSDSPEGDVTEFEALQRQADESTLQALQMARRLPEILREQIDLKLKTMAHHADLAEAKTILDGLQTLNQSLARMPTAEELEMPTLLEYDPLEPALDRDTLQKWGDEVEWLLGQSVDAREADLSASHALQELGAGEALQLVGELAHNLQKHLHALQDAGQRLRIAREPAQDIASTAPLEPQLTEGTPANSLNILEKEATSQVRLVAILEQARQHFRAGRAIAGLTFLYEEIEQCNLLDSPSSDPLWLLAPQREMLTLTHDRLHKALRGALRQQVSEILGNQTTAKKQLQEQVLFVPRIGRIAQECREVIREEVDQQVKNIGPKRRDEVRVLWGIVIEATAPWAEQTTPDQRSRLTPKGQTRPSSDPGETPGSPERKAASGCRSRLGLKRPGRPLSDSVKAPATPESRATARSVPPSECPRKPVRRDE